VANETNQTPKLKSDQSSKIIIVTHPELASSSTISHTVKDKYLEDLLLDSKVEQFNNIREQNHYVRLDLHAINLSYTSLSGANLSDTDLTKADLIGANLIGAKLVGANLSAANLNQANLDRAELRTANVAEADFAGANLQFADLYCVENLYDSNLRGTDLRNAIDLPISKGEARRKGATVVGCKICSFNCNVWKVIAYTK